MSLKILVVDDHKDVVDTISNILTSNGFSVEEAFSGKECLNKLDKTIHLVFLDIMMPMMNGYDVAKEIRKRFNKDIKIIYVSIKQKQEVDLSSADGFIQKPFGIKDILNTANSKVRAK